MIESNLLGGGCSLKQGILQLGVYQLVRTWGNLGGDSQMTRNWVSSSSEP